MAEPLPSEVRRGKRRWDEVNEAVHPATYTIDSVGGRLHRYGDLYEGVLTTKQRLGPALRALAS